MNREPAVASAHPLPAWTVAASTWTWAHSWAATVELGLLETVTRQGLLKRAPPACDGVAAVAPDGGAELPQEVCPF
jgi:hypothetical protein